MSTLLRSRPLVGEYLASRTGSIANKIGSQTKQLKKRFAPKSAQRTKFPLGLLAGVGAGAALMYVFDPQQGASRRAKVKDKSAHAYKQVCDSSQALWKGGLLHRDPVSDETLQARVRAKLGRLTRHSQAIGVSVNEGIVSLSGPALASEAPHLLKKIAHIRGVQNVDDRLEWRENAASLPAVEAAAYKVRDALGEWSTTSRVAAGTAGSSLLAGGLYKRGPVGIGLAALGAGLLIAGALARPASASGKAAPDRSEGSPS